MPTMTLQQVAKTLACTVTETSTAPLDVYSAWATALGVSDAITRVDDDDWFYYYTLNAPFFAGNNDHKGFWLSTEGAIGLHCLLTPDDINHHRYIYLPYSAVNQPLSKPYAAPLLCVSFRPDVDQWGRDVRIQVTPTATIFCSRQTNWNNTVHYSTTAGKIESGKITLVTNSNYSSIPVYLHEVEEYATSSVVPSSKTKQSLLLDTQASGTIRTYEITIPKSISDISDGALVFTFAGQPAYTAPAGDAIAFSFMPSGPASEPVTLAARAVIDLAASINLVIKAPLPMQASCTLDLFLLGTLRVISPLFLKAKGTLLLLAKRVAAKALTGLGMKMHIVSDPQRPGTVLDQYLRVWFNGIPSKCRLSYQVDDQPEQQPAAVWENPNSPQPAVLRIDGAEIPGDGLTHRVTVSAWQQVGSTVSPKATISEYLATPDVRPAVSPEWCGATLIRQATGLAYHSTGHLPDLVEVQWRHPGAVAIFAKFQKSGKTTIAKVGVADHQEAFYRAEGVSALIGYTANPIDVYLGVAAIARGTYGPITWQAKPIKIKGFTEFQLPLAASHDTATMQTLGYIQLQDAVRATLAAQLGASAPANLATINTKVYERLIYRIKDVMRKGGTVDLDDLGTFKANWSASGRAVGFTPSPGFKAGTRIGRVLSDDQAKELG